MTTEWEGFTENKQHNLDYEPQEISFLRQIEYGFRNPNIEGNQNNLKITNRINNTN